MKVPKVQIRLSSAAELILASLEPHARWIEEVMGVPLSETITLELDCNPGDVVAEELLPGLAVAAATKERNNTWRQFIEEWKLPSVTPRIAMSLQRERKSNAAPLPVWELDWQDCPVAFKLRGLAHYVMSVKIPVVFPPSDMPVLSPVASQHWFIVRKEDAAKVLLIEQHVQNQTERYLETGRGLARLQGKYNWNALVLDASVRRLVQRDFEIFFEREDWFRQHNLPYRRGYLFWGSPGNGKSATLRVMAAHPYIRAFTLDLSDREEKSSDVLHLFQKAGENTPSLVILEDLDRAFLSEGKRTKERTVSFQNITKLPRWFGNAGWCHRSSYGE